MQRHLHVIMMIIGKCCFSYIVDNLNVIESDSGASCVKNASC